MKASEFVARINELAAEIGGDPEIVIESEYGWRSLIGYEQARAEAIALSPMAANRSTDRPPFVQKPDGNTMQAIAIY